MAKHNETGTIGETITTNVLIRHGFEILCRNYRKKWGEIDIVAQKDSKLHFVEVKTVSRRSFNEHFDKEIDNYHPEDNMHPWKLQRLRRAVQTYLLEKYPTNDPEWQFDLSCVFLDEGRRVAKIRFMKNLII